MTNPPQPHSNHLRTFITGTAHLPTVEEQRQRLHADLAGLIDEGLIASLDAVITDATFTDHADPERIHTYRPAVDLLHRLRALRNATLRDAIIQVAGITPH